MLHAFYTYKQVNNDYTMTYSLSKSPLKPKLVMNKLQETHALDIITHNEFDPLTKEDFLIAHSEEYVDSFFSGNGHLARSNSIPWSETLVETVTYTNASLYNSIKYATENYNSFVLSPTSGFHHAQPHKGLGFCTFSGQVVASVKLYRETGSVGAYIDLDGHYGNSIGDTQDFCPDVKNAISFNYNAKGQNASYIDNLKRFLYRELGPSIRDNTTHYVVWCHGADSHIDDDFVGADYVDTDHWLQASDIFYSFIETQRRQGYNVPVVTSLFGGYRRNNYQFVIDLHCKDIITGIEMFG